MCQYLPQQQVSSSTHTVYGRKTLSAHFLCDYHNKGHKCLSPARLVFNRLTVSALTLFALPCHTNHTSSAHYMTNCMSLYETSTHFVSCCCDLQYTHIYFTQMFTLSSPNRNYVLYTMVSLVHSFHAHNTHTHALQRQPGQYLSL